MTELIVSREMIEQALWGDCGHVDAWIVGAIFDSRVDGIRLVLEGADIPDCKLVRAAISVERKRITFAPVE